MVHTKNKKVMAMAATNVPKVYFLRSKTVCRGEELKFRYPPRPISPPRPSSKKLSGAGFAPVRKYYPERLEVQNKTIADNGLALLNLEARQYQLVKPCLSSGHVSSRGFFFHANFEAKPVDVPGAPVELFFVELSLGSGTNDKSIIAYVIQSLGCIDSLPDDNDDDHVKRCSMCTVVDPPGNKTTHGEKMGTKIRHPKDVKLNYCFQPHRY